MAAAKIRKCLFIGLGGTGMTSLLHTKQVFMETYGEVPPMIGFLGIDTDGAAYNKELPSKNGPVGLDPHEQMAIRVDKAQDILRVNKDRFTWVPEQNFVAMISMTQGAGQIRTNGRFALTCNEDSVKNKVNSVLSSINNAENSINEKYEIVGDGIEIHIVFSVCGGTGCGTFLNMACLLRDMLDNYSVKTKLIGYGILPDVFRSMANNGMTKVRPNAYGAIQDLDYMMHLNGELGGKGVTLDWLRDSRTYKKPPFDAFFFVDNKNTVGDSYNHVDQLGEMISLALITSSGVLSSATGSTMDNIEKEILNGDYDVNQKKAWAAGLGICEILFRGADLAKIYSYKASKRIIESLIMNCQDADTIANNWITEVNINEHTGDPVIDHMLPKSPKMRLSSIDNKKSPIAEAEIYIKSAMPKDDDIQSKYKELTEVVFPSFHKLIVDSVNKNCGVGVAESIIMSLQEQVNVFMGEMVSEKEECMDSRDRLKQMLDNACKDLAEYADRWIKSKETLSEKEEDVCNAAIKIVENEREIVRRDYAIRFYTALNAKILAERDKVANVKKVLMSVNADLTRDIAKMQEAVSRSAEQTFQIDLASDKVGNILVKEDEIVMTDFIGSLDGGKIYDFDTMEVGNVKKNICDYAASLKGAKEYDEMSIDAVLNAMSQEEFDKVLKLANAKSQVLLPTDFRGFIAKQNPSDNYYIGVPNKETSRFVKGDAFKNTLKSANDVTAASLGIQDRVIIYHQMGVIPPYAIKSLKACEEEYREYGVRCHFDAKIYTDMIREKYSLEPAAREDDSIDIWVNGFIFGRIRNNGGTYEYYDDERGDVINDYWIPLDNYRDKAFEMFKSHIAEVRSDYESFFNNEAKRKGAEEMASLIADAKDNYWGKFSQINMDKKDLAAYGNDRIADLFRKELEYVKKKLTAE